MKVIIFGAGNICRSMLSYPLQDGVEILFICDNDREKWNEKIAGYSVKSPEEIKGVPYDLILIASLRFDWVEEIIEQLSTMEVSEDKIMLSTGFYGIEFFAVDLDRIFSVEKKKHEPFKKGPAVIYQEYKGETSKSYKRRLREGFFDKYCQGEGLDIGYGSDPITPDCSGWDMRNGDAQYLSDIEDESFDYVYSSHCLEHMSDVRVALKNWFRIVREGGYLILAIPHRDLYEKKRRLPSRWNGDHKHMFLIGKAESPDTLDIVEEIRKSLTDFDVKYIKACDEGHTITDPYIHSNGEYQIEIVLQKKHFCW